MDSVLATVPFILFKNHRTIATNFAASATKYNAQSVSFEPSTEQDMIGVREVRASTFAI